MALYALYNVPACRHARAIRSTHGSTRCVPRLSVQRQALQVRPAVYVDPHGLAQYPLMPWNDVETD
jgi:hypothetical protein